MTDLSRYRKYFPISRNRIYLNHAATSPLPTYVTEAIEAHLAERSVTIGDNWDTVLEKVEKLREGIAKLIGTTADRIALTQNTTDGLNIIAAGLEWQPGDEILLPEIEFPANIFPWKNLEAKGVNVRFIKTPEGGLTPELLESHITEKTKLVSVSFVEYLSGYKHDLRPLQAVCQRHNVHFTVDGIQGAGIIPINVEQDAIDAMSSGGHKWLMFPQGFGYLYLTNKFQRQLKPAYGTWVGLEDSNDFQNHDRKRSKDARGLETGSFNTISVAGALASVNMILEIGPEKMYNHIKDLTTRLIERLPEAGFELYTNPDIAHRSGIVTAFKKDNFDAESCRLYLPERSIIGSNRSNMVRFAAHYYNTIKEIDVVIEELKNY